MKKAIKIFFWIGAFLLLMVLILIRVQPAEPDPDMFEESVIEFCEGKSKAIKGAKPYDPQAEYHPVIWIDTHYMSSTNSNEKKVITSDRTDSLFTYNQGATLWVRPATVFDYELVVCSFVKEVGRDEYCSYTGGVSLHAYSTTKEFKVYRMDTGELIGGFTLASRVGCPAATTSNRNIYNNVDYDNLREQLDPFVFSSIP